jgi:hypothetical protein
VSGLRDPKETRSWPYNLVGEGLPETTNKWLSPQINHSHPFMKEKVQGDLYMRYD